MTLGRLFAPRTLSLRRQLVIWVVLPQIVLWLAGGLASYRLAVGYVNQAADATLSQATRTLSRQVKPIGDGLLIDLPKAAQVVLEADPSDRLLYTVSTPPGHFILGNDNIPLPPKEMVPRADEPYFYDGDIQLADQASPSRVRIAVLYQPYTPSGGQTQWMLVQVARSMAHRQELWQRIFIDILLPLSVLMLLMTMIVWAATGAGLAPLLRLRGEVEGRNPTNLTPLRIDEAPQEVKALVHALNELLASVHKNVTSQQRFIADAAHQLRTPLAGLKTQTELALQATDAAERAQRLAFVHESASRSAHLINRLLMLARAEPEAAHAQEVAITDLGSVVRELVLETVPRALRAGIDLGLHAPDDIPALPVVANSLLLREAIGNVLDNAIEYAGRGAEITFSFDRSDTHAELIISDTGPGIAMEDRERVFERFVRATEQGVGCGLGLAIVKQIVTQHGGSVSLRGTEPHGLTVDIRLPLAGSSI
ncbi:sensor histidine kinase [Roseateles sp. P5_E11]